MKIQDRTHPIQLRLVICILTSAMLLACGKGSQSEEKSTTTSASYECYSSYTAQDSVFLKVTYDGDRVRGEIVYKLFEKDKNVGDFEGELSGDTIFALYNFVSEGVASTREVVFLKQGNTLLEGFAPMDESGTRFKNKEVVDFAGIVLQAGDCRD